MWYLIILVSAGVFLSVGHKKHTKFWQMWLRSLLNLTILIVPGLLIYWAISNLDYSLNF